MAKSSKQWLRRHVTDAYVRAAKKQGYRSRAAYKLLEIDAREQIFRAGQTIVDLGAAPGSWSQVAAEKAKPGARVVAIDLLAIAPIPGVTVLKGDFRDALLLEALKGEKADLVLSDLSPNLSGIRGVDQARTAELVTAAADLAARVLKPRGRFVTKLFHGEALDELRAALEARFASVRIRKPAASRGESRETYAVCSEPRGNRTG
jgi:23S rRNA (uridine2552-2'-O)-methyltransferase